jgi:zinc D-Ala-D-Ala carboxypeptidase
MKLTSHFHLEEFLVSETARRKGLSIPHPPPMILENLTLLARYCLEPLRLAVRKPVVIISGWRPEWLNKLVGGSANSQHMHGEAADIIIPGLSTLQVCHKIIELEQAGSLRFDQLIHEFPPNGWVHVSFSTETTRRNVLTAVKQNKRTIYLGGLYNA